MHLKLKLRFQEPKPAQAFAQSRVICWSAAALTGFCCRVAGFAVNALRQLATKLLLRAERAELTSFSHQDEALRPFVAVLKHCDSAVVREQVVQSIAQTITAHPRGLGTGPLPASVMDPKSSALADLHCRLICVSRPSCKRQPYAWKNT